MPSGSGSLLTHLRQRRGQRLCRARHNPGEPRPLSRARALARSLSGSPAPWLPGSVRVSLPLSVSVCSLCLTLSLSPSAPARGRPTKDRPRWQNTGRIVRYRLVRPHVLSKYVGHTQYRYMLRVTGCICALINTARGKSQMPPRSVLLPGCHSGSTLIDSTESVEGCHRRPPPGRATSAGAARACPGFQQRETGRETESLRRACSCSRSSREPRSPDRARHGRNR